MTDHKRPQACAPRIIGTRQIGRVAIGGASWSLGRHQDARNAIATIHAAIDSGIRTRLAGRPIRRLFYCEVETYQSSA